MWRKWPLRAAAVLAVAIALVLVAVAVDVLRVPSELEYDDVSFEAAPRRQAGLWDDLGFVPGRPGAFLLGVDDDVDYRRTLAIWVRVPPGTDIFGPDTGVYQKAPPEVLERVTKLQAACREFDVPLGAAALQFALAHPVVCAVLTGPKSAGELEGILAWWNRSIPGEFWQALAERKLVAKGTPLAGGITA